MQDNVLFSKDINHFAKHGYVRVREAFSPAAALQMQAFLWEQIKTAHGAHKEDRETWACFAGTWNHSPRGLNKAANDLVYAPVAGPRMCKAIDQLLGPGTWSVPKSWGGFLVSFPRPDPSPWSLVADGWHWDGQVNFDHPNRLHGLFIFTFYSSVGPQGGRTLALSGSHRLLQRFLRSLAPGDRPKHTPLIKRFAASHPYLAELTGAVPSAPDDRAAKFMETTTDVDGVPTRVLELTGEPGDAVLCHPSIFHAINPNRADVPRFMRVKGLAKRPAHPDRARLR